MHSSLGNAFGVAISGTIYGTFASQMNMALGGFMGVVLNAVIALIAFFAILLLVPKKQTNL